MYTRRFTHGWLWEKPTQTHFRLTRTLHNQQILYFETERQQKIWTHNIQKRGTEWTGFTTQGFFWQADFPQTSVISTVFGSRAGITKKPWHFRKHDMLWILFLPTVERPSWLLFWKAERVYHLGFMIWYSAVTKWLDISRIIFGL